MDGSVMGTHYMPPEQAQGRLDDIDARADIFALGATLYELFARQRMYSSDIKDLHMLLMKVNDVDITLDRSLP